MPLTIQDIDVCYTNNKEYRQCIRKVFEMASTKADQSPPNTLDQDDLETMDEQDYDEDAAVRTLDHIVENTEQYPLFQELYLTAAALMISQDTKIGISVLFSYDYFQYFYPLLLVFKRNPEDLTETSPAYLLLKEKIT